MINTKCLYKFTDTIKRPNILKFTHRVVNDNVLEDECRIYKLFSLLYGEQYYVDKIRPYMVELVRGVA